MIFRKKIFCNFIINVYHADYLSSRNSIITNDSTVERSEVKGIIIKVNAKNVRNRALIPNIELTKINNNTHRSKI